MRREAVTAQQVGRQTFAFLGETDASTTGRLRPVLRDALAAATPVAAETAELGAFPDRGRVRVVWAALGPEAELARLARRVRSALASAGAAHDEKPFRAHVTLARSDPPWPVRWRDDLAAIDCRGGRVPCDALALVASTLAPGGPTHRTIDSFALGASGGVA